MRTTTRTLRPAELDQSAVGRLSRMDTMQTQGLTKGLQEREQAKLGQITEAMKRLDAGTYGRCVVCGDPIAYERLLVLRKRRTAPAAQAASCGARLAR